MESEKWKDKGKCLNSTLAVAGVLMLVLLTCCTGGKREVHFERFEQLLFGTPVAELQKTLIEHQVEYSTPLLNVDPYNREYMTMLADFVEDPGVGRIYEVTDSMYGDISFLEQDLGRALAKGEELLPGMHYEKFYTLITADFDDYQNRVFCTDKELAVSIDRYAVGALPSMVPAYIERMSRREYIAADCMAAIARVRIALPDEEMTLLDYAIAEGKTLYFVEQTMPWVHDTIRLRYTGEQLKWMKSNEEQVWAWLLQNKMLYSNDYGTFHNLVDDAPKTNAFGEGSAPRTPAYIGWQIVKKYMKKSGKTIAELFEETDSQKILTESGWRP